MVPTVGGVVTGGEACPMVDDDTGEMIHKVTELHRKVDHAQLWGWWPSAVGSEV